MLGNTKGKQLYNYTPDYVLFDLETTGISRNTDEVIEISAVKVRNGRVVDEFSHLVNPGKSIPYAASMVNNITNQIVRNAPHFDRVLEYFVEFVRMILWSGTIFAVLICRLYIEIVNVIWGRPFPMIT